MKKSTTCIIVFACALASAFPCGAGIVSPKNGGPYPPGYRELKERSKDAFALKHAWIARRAKQTGGEGRYRLAPPAENGVIRNAARALGGKLSVPVVLGLYAGITVPPATRNAYDQELFTGPWTTGTMREYWREVSYDLFDVTGTVFDWQALSGTEAYYIGTSYGTVPGNARTGTMIGELLDGLDPTTDFGVYDNDGADGVPNSGDDDGFVDVLLVVHPTFGAECDYSQHMWSHSWTYSSWPESGGEPYATNDPAAGGGFIRVEDYIVAPARSCELGQIEIGVICHELGHAIGLPDLYDYNGSSSGIGFWGLMGAGNWNTPASPAHLCSWSREQLGWLNPVETDWHPRSISLDPVGTSGETVKMPLPTRRFKRSTYGAANHALICGYTEAEADARGWSGGAGYGNGWNESVYREFTVDASRPVSLQMNVTTFVETGYDFGRIFLEVDGAVDTLGVYTGTTNLHETLDIGASLPAGPCTFMLRFEFTSDISWSDEDGYVDSDAGYAFNVDNVVVSGGGIDYAADFELDSGGFRNGSAPAEYFLVENRRETGFDSNLKGQGMLLWHAENSIAYSSLGNSGGTSNTQARGLVLEEADGEYNLLASDYLGGNYGDAGDPYPGSEGNRSFGPATVPRSETNGGAVAPVTITGITQSGSSLTAVFTGGMPAPSIAAVAPDTVDKEGGDTAVLDIRGTWMQYGADAYLSLAGDTVSASGIEWLGEERIIATFPVEMLSAGDWDLSVVSGDAQTATVQGAVNVRSVFLSARVESGRDYLLAEWTVMNAGEVRGCLLFRAEDGGAFDLVTDTLRGSPADYAYRDSSVRPGSGYSYRIAAYLADGREETLTLAGPFRIGVFPFVADQNYPNPFNGETTLSFFVPAAQRVAVEIYDVTGSRVENFGEREYARGTHTIRWSPTERGVGAGVYFCVVRSGSVSRSVKIVYIP